MQITLQNKAQTQPDRPAYACLREEQAGVTTADSSVGFYRFDHIIGYIGLHLPASVHLSAVPIWTFDKKLSDISKEFGVDFQNGER